jgi:hypothetical protein
MNGSNISVLSNNIYYGLRLRITTPAVNTQTSPFYITALSTSAAGGGFANFRLSARDDGTGNYVFGARITGQAGDPFSFGTTSFSTSQTLLLILEGVHNPNNTTGIDNLNLYVNPTDGILAHQSAYLSNNIGAGAPPTTVGSFIISQFGNATFNNVAFDLSQVVVAGDFTSAYGNLVAIPEPATMSLMIASIIVAAAYIYRRRRILARQMC